jgi:hypothetical protein
MRRDTLHPDELLKPDLLGEIILTASALAMFLPFLLLVAVAVSHAVTH